MGALADEITLPPAAARIDWVGSVFVRPQCLRLSLRADLAEVGRVRDLVDEIQALCGLSDERAFDVKVTLSEACANAIEHAGSAVLVVAWLLSDRLLFEITNDGGFMPGLQKDTDNRRRGLGLPLMVSLADQVHVSRLEPGITGSLTFFLALRARAAPTAVRFRAPPAREAGARPEAGRCGDVGFAPRGVRILEAVPLPPAWQTRAWRS
jgi:serine/threonine-protein kinase RsbW